MKANESIEKYPARVREYANYTVKSAKNVCKTYGARIAGSESEIKARDYFKNDIDKFCDESSIEKFTLSDKAYTLWTPVCAVLMIVSAAAYMLGLAAVSLVLTAAAFLLALSEAVFHGKILDGFTGKKESANLTGTRKASGEVKRRIILSGHMDSPYEKTFVYYGGKSGAKTVITASAIGAALSIIASAYAVATGKAVSLTFAFSSDSPVAVKIFCIVMLVFVPFYIAAMFFVNYKRPVTGANTLAGCFTSLAVVKFLSDNDIRFENTQVDVLLTSGNEAGLRGAMAYAKNHGDEIKNSGVETVFVAFDAIHDFDFKAVYEKDMAGTAKNDSRVINLIKQGASIAGFDDVAVKKADMCSTDAGVMSKAGIAAASFAAVDTSSAKFNRTRLDTEEILDLKSIEAGVKIALETTFLFDEKGIK